MADATVADHLRAWIAAARGAIEWHIETGDVELPVPESFRLPPLGDIAEGPAPRPMRSAAPPPGRPTEAPVQRAGPGGFARLAQAAGAALPEPARRARAEAPPAAPTPAQPASSNPAQPASPRPSPASAPSAAPIEIPGDGPPAAAAALRVLRDQIGDCTRCPLHRGRTELVFGAGHPRARVMFVADQPGSADDQLGLPFVDGAGQLLGRMVRAMGLSRSQVYLTHLVKCHDPEQGPEPGLDACGGYLARQIEIVRPDVIIALGGVAARQLSGVREQLPHLRARWLEHGEVPLLATFHPSALAQHPQSKRQVWSDLKMAMRKLGLPLPGRR